MALAAAALLLASLPRPAEPAPRQGVVRVRVTGFRGPRGRQLRQQLVRRLRRARGIRVVRRRAALTLRGSVRRKGVGKGRRRRARYAVSVRIFRSGTMVKTIGWRVRRRGALVRRSRPHWRRVVAAVRWTARAPLHVAETDGSVRRMATASEIPPAAPASGPPPRDGAGAPAVVGPGDEWVESGDVATLQRDADGYPTGVDAAISRQTGPALPALEATASVRIFTRALRFRDDLFGTFRPYELNGAPAIGARFAWFPQAHFRGGLAAQLGLVGSMDYAVGISSQTADGQTLDTRSLALSIGLRARLPLGKHLISGTLGYDYDSFSVEHPADASGEPEGGVNGIPDVSYHAIRIGAGGRLELPLRMALIGRFAVLAVLDSGAIGSEEFFPRASATGIDAEALVALKLTRWLEARAGIGLRHYFLSMNPEPGDPSVAGGATDQYLSALFALAVRPL